MFYAFSAWIFWKFGIGADANISEEWFSYIVIAITLARTNELVMAFYGDAIGRIKNNGSDLESQLKISDERRIYLLTFAYAEIIVNFGITYFFIQKLYTYPIFEKPISSIWDTLYFSGITITTTGFGDFSPKAIARAPAVYEALVGIVFIALGLAAYLSQPRSPTVSRECHPTLKPPIQHAIPSGAPPSSPSVPSP